KPPPPSAISTAPSAERTNSVPTAPVAKAAPPPPPPPPTPRVEKATSTAPVVQFFPIPRPPGDGAVSVRRPEQLHRLEKDIKRVQILTLNEKHLNVQESGEREIIVDTKSNSLVNDPVTVAKLSYDKRIVAFDWGKRVENETETAAEILDAVVRICCEDGD